MHNAPLEGLHDSNDPRLETNEEKSGQMFTELKATDKLRSEAAKEFGQTIENNFNDIDTDKDNFISQEEANNSKLPDKTKDIFIHHLSALQTISDDELSYRENDGVTRADLALLQEQADIMPEALNNARLVSNALLRYTTPENRHRIDPLARIFPHDLKAAMDSEKFSAKDQEVFELARKNFKQIADRHSISRSDAYRYPDKVASKFSPIYNLGSELIDK